MIEEECFIEELSQELLSLQENIMRWSTRWFVTRLKLSIMPFSNIEPFQTDQTCIKGGSIS